MQAEPLEKMTQARRAWELVGGPVVAGAVTGLLLGTTWWLYALAALLSLLGGIPAGGQHARRATALARGAWAGLLWGTALLLVHATTGTVATVELPDPRVVFLLYAVVPSVLAAGLGHHLLVARRAPEAQATGGSG